MEKTIGMRIRECRMKMGMTQEELASICNVSRQSITKWEADIALPELNKLLILGNVKYIVFRNKTTVSAYENDKIDIKISILKQIAALLGTTVAYLADDEKTEIGEDVMQVALLLQGMQNEELRKVAVEQVKLLTGVK